MKMHVLILQAFLIGAPALALAAGQAPTEQKISQAECESLWMQVNPSGTDTISEKQSQPFVTDFQRANPDNDGTLDKAEFSKACDNGLVRGLGLSGAGSGDTGSR